MHLILDAAEIREARAVVAAVDPRENDLTHGVAMVVARGQRRWTAWRNLAIASTAPVPAPGAPDRIAVVSRRLVEFAADRADLGDQVELGVSDDGAAFVAGPIQVDFQAPAPRVVPASVVPFSGSAASATTIASDLAHFFAMGRVLPIGVDLHDVDVPPFAVAIDDGAVVAMVDWSPAGAAATRLVLTADTTGEGAAVVNPSFVTHILGHLDPDEAVRLSIPDGARFVEIAGETWTALVRADPIGGGDDEGDDAGDDGQLRLFEPSELDDQVDVDPLAGASLTDIRALAIDLDVEVRIRATASWWAIDVRLQMLFATDEDERVVLAFLAHAEPSVEACRAIVEGPHVEARRELALRNISTELLEALAADPDPVAAERASRAVSRRLGLESPSATVSR